MGYNKKDERTLTYEMNKRRIRCEIQNIAAYLANEAIAEMDDEFTEALNRGDILELEGTKEELVEYLRRASERVLGAATRRVHALNGRS